MKKPWFMRCESFFGIFIGAHLGVGCGTNYNEPKNVFGPDDRTNVTSSVYPWPTIGWLDSGCTGTLVGRTLVLTAAHCVFDDATKKIRPNLTQFIPHLVAGRTSTPVAIETVWAGSTTPEKDRSKDWAILKLARPAGETNRWMEVDSVAFPGHLPYTVNLAGYSLDRNDGKTATAHKGCTVRSVVTGFRLLHDCDATAGVSGGPLFIYKNRQATIIALTVSEYRHGASDSLKRERYEDEYANVGLSAEHFVEVWQKLRASVDKGLPAPTLLGVVTSSMPNHPVMSSSVNTVMANAEGASGIPSVNVLSDLDR